jgi:hypothetical protein
MNIPLSTEEIPVVASFVCISLRRDLADFARFSSKFNENYLNIFEEKIKIVNEVVSGKIYTQELVKITSDMRGAMSELRPMLNKVEGYVKMAGKNLTTTVSGFGISEVRKPLNRGNVEKTLKSLGDMFYNIEVNRSILSEQGFNAETENQLREIRDKISRLNQMQNQIISQRAIAVEDNATTFNALWEVVSETLIAGRSLYKGVDAARMKDYTITELKKRVKHIVKKEDDEEAEEEKK